MIGQDWKFQNPFSTLDILSMCIPKFCVNIVEAKFLLLNKEIERWQLLLSFPCLGVGCRRENKALFLKELVLIYFLHDSRIVFDLLFKCIHHQTQDTTRHVVFVVPLSYVRLRFTFDLHQQNFLRLISNKYFPFFLFV